MIIIGNISSLAGEEILSWKNLKEETVHALALDVKKSNGDLF